MKHLFYGMTILFSFWGCDSFLPPAADSKEVLAEPISDLTEQQLRNHLIGDAEFGRIFSRQDGLGPLFVSNSCESCHIGDGKGHPLTTLTRFGKYVNNEWDIMKDKGGPQLQNRAITGYPPENIPIDATGVTNLMPPAVTGLGFLESITDQALLDLADPDDNDGDGISGRLNYIVPPDFLKPMPTHISDNGKYIGRFGKKAATINLLHQVVIAYIEDMGITSDFTLQDNYNYQQGQFSGDDVDDPEISATIVNNVVFYIRTLKVPPRRDQNNANVLAGEQLFNQIKCVSCHISTMVTGKSDIEALSEKTIHPYTDLLLHDMGPGLDDGYTEGSATTSEWRTAPLWGIGLVKDSQGGASFFMHDGRATNLNEAILLHGGEAENSKNMFMALSENEKRQLIRFLESL